MRVFLHSPLALWEGVIELGDEQRDLWQWAIVGGALILALGLSQLLARTLFASGTRCRGACERFFKPTKKFGGFPLSAAVLLWISYFCVRAAELTALKKVALEKAAKAKDAIERAASDEALANVAVAAESNVEVLHAAAIFATGFAIFYLAYALSKGKWVPRVVGIAAVLAFALHLAGVLDSFVVTLQDYNLPLGDLQINPWAIFSGVVALFVLLWLANLSSRFLDAGLHAQGDIPGSMRVLVGKVARFVFYVAAVLIALKIGGFNLGALTVFSGALGLGIGFGLQKVISNLVSGIIILLDKSIKPGDVIEIDDAYGSINSLRTRYVSVITRDRKEYLIPNEDFITNPVINWSFTGKEIRIRTDIGVAYGSDLRKAIAICVEAAGAQERVLETPEVQCLLMGFGDSSVNLQLRFWIRDAHNGVANVKSAVLLAVWDRFAEAGIEIPFPQVDLHVKTDKDKAEES